MALEKQIEQNLHQNDSGDMEDATLHALYEATAQSVLQDVRGQWQAERTGKAACYFSAEFLLGRMVYANLLNLGKLEEFETALATHGLYPDMFEDIEDAALGNGGLGRLAACFLDSGATEGYRLDGYGIRYKYGLFKQYFEDGFQKEAPDDWQRFGDPFSVRREDERVRVEFGDGPVWAVPYDMPVIGYGGKTVNNLRLWQAEAVQPFDLEQFNNQNYAEAFAGETNAEAIYAVLYPNDDTDAGKRLRLKQQYFFSSASLQSILAEFRAGYGGDWTRLPEAYSIQLNDTHPTVAIPELLRLLMNRECMDFETAFGIVQKVFAYTNHTLLAEALEKWDEHLFISVLPHVYPYVVMLNNRLRRDLLAKGVAAATLPGYEIVTGGQVHMARMAIFATHSTNGVAALHTELLKTVALQDWYEVYPERFNNKTNGVTQRRWLALCNPELADILTRRIGGGWITNLDELEKLKAFLDDDTLLAEFSDAKRAKKEQLAKYIREAEGVEIPVDAMYDIQVKRLHEYKRQLLNAFSILDIYFRLKDGDLPDFAPMVFLFGAKAAPGYWRAKGIIKFINDIAALVNRDEEVNGKLRVVFVQNYGVSYAEKLIPAADLSEQISTAGYEASGTSNMKFMLNGAPTLGTLDGANVEIVEQAGEDNNYIFGARVEQLATIAQGYNPRAIYEGNPRLRRVVDTLVDGTFSDCGTGVFRDLYDSLLQTDTYYLMLDFEDYVNTKLRANSEWQQTRSFAQKCLANIAAAGKFSSDRTIRQYAEEIWGL